MSFGPAWKHRITLNYHYRWQREMYRIPDRIGELSLPLPIA
jgi:hypothetical protein